MIKTKTLDLLSIKVTTLVIAQISNSAWFALFYRRTFVGIE